MIRLTGEELINIKPYFKQAAQVALQATCLRARCGSVIVKDEVIIGKGYNSPPLGDENQRMCHIEKDLSKKPKHDKTCCVHAEWSAILDTCKNNADKISGSTLYFMRLDDADNFTDFGIPFCTTCSRLAMESGVSEFAIWNDESADIYSSAEYNKKTYEFYIR
jgi:deoxycytidylate deaminase